MKHTMVGATIWRRLVFGLALCMGFIHGVAQAAPGPWGTGSYTYYADGKTLPKVLNDFAQNFGLRLKLTVDPKGTLSGRINAATPTEFLDRVTSAQGLTWFYQGGTLYVVPVADWITRSAPVSPATLPELRRALSDLRVVDDRFGWAELSEQGLVVISGPREYVNQVVSTVAAMNLGPGGARIAVFPLKHANVEDRVISSRDREVTIPGVATILRSIVEGGDRERVLAAATIGTGRNAAAKSSAVESGGDKGESKGDARSARGSSTKPLLEGNRRGIIQADSRLNAIIVRDAQEMIPVYEKLIASLDVPTALVEIEAMIVDVSKDQLTELGIDWTGALGKAGATFGDPSAATSASTFTVGKGARLVGSNVVLDQANYFLARVRALETNGNARVLSKPRILTTDNVLALIDLSETFYVKVSGERVASLEQVSTGVMLRVTPHIVGGNESEREIQLVIDIEDGGLVNRDRLDLPVVQRSVISTQAVIKESQSLLVGGYNSERDEKSVSSIPILGKIPLLGAMFRTSNVDKQRRDRLFMITPRVLKVYDKPQVVGSIDTQGLIGTQGAVRAQGTVGAQGAVGVQGSMIDTHGSVARVSSSMDGPFYGPTVHDRIAAGLSRGR